MKRNQSPSRIHIASAHGQVLTALALAGSLVLGTPAAVDAADTGEPGEPNRGERGHTSAGMTSDRAATRPDMRIRQYLEASRLIELGAVDGTGAPIGKIKDLAIDLDSGRINFVALSVGGIFRAGNKLTAIPAEALHILPGGQVQIDVTQQNLDQLPSLALHDWLTTTFDAQTFNQIYRAMGLELAKMHSNRRPIKATELIDGEVLLPRQSKASADIKDIALDLRNGHAPYVVVRLDGIPGVSTKTVAVPTVILSRDNEGNRLQLSLSNTQLERAPAMEPRGWAHELASRDVGARIYDAYGVTPYWEHGERPAAAVGGSSEAEPEVLQRRGQ